MVSLLRTALLGHAQHGSDITLLEQLHSGLHLMPSLSLASQPTMGWGHSNSKQPARCVEVGPLKFVRPGSIGTIQPVITSAVPPCTRVVGEDGPL